MNLSWIDWTVMAVAVVGLRLVSLSTRRYMRGVADFLSANRSAGRYLLTIAGQMGNTGAISIIALFEMYRESGLPTVWWAMMSIPANAIILLTGWVYYRLRETRALTLAQFLEIRYGRRFRVFAGIVIWTSGILNFGIFPAVAARFFIYFCGLPDTFGIPGLPFHIATFPAVMAVDLLLALTFVNLGGQVSVIVTECVQGMFSAFAFIVLAGYVLITMRWSSIEHALMMAPAGQSMLHPFQTSNVSTFNVTYFLIGVFGTFYSASSWQGASGFQSSARTPHEQKMGLIIGVWRQIPLTLMQIVLPIAAYAAMRTPSFGQSAHAVQVTLAAIDNPTIRNQMHVPVVLAHLLPAGIKGLLAVVMLFFSFTCHDTYMHSWGSIFVQDVVMPFRRKPITPEQHIRLLRWSIVGVALFAFLFSLVYPQSDRIFMFMAITGTIWLGGSGAVIVGGLYWPKGTTAAAFSAIWLGAIVGCAGLIVPVWYKNRFGHDFPVNGQWMWMLSMIGAIVTYVAVSLATWRRVGAFDLDRLLHRGQYRVASDHVEEQTPNRWMLLLGVTPEFKRVDRVLAFALVFWNLGWLAVFLIVTAWNLVTPVPNAWWSAFWRAYLWLHFCIAVPATIWFTIGGVHDVRALFRTLASAVRDHSDDGRVRTPAQPEPQHETGEVS